MASRIPRIGLAFGVLLAGLSMAPADPPGDRQAEPPASERLRVLEPLVGEWIIGSDDAQPGEFNRSTFTWKGGKSCLQYKSFRMTPGGEIAEDEGLLIWDAEKKAIRELTVDSDDQFTRGTWTPDKKELVGEFEHFNRGMTVSRSILIMEFVNENTIHLWPVVARGGERVRTPKPIVFKRKGEAPRP